MVGFGTVLEQEMENARAALEHFPASTSLAEQVFVATELEVAGLVFVLEHFEVAIYVLGSQVTVYTDHQTLVKLKSQIKGILVRWYLRLAIHSCQQRSWSISLVGRMLWQMPD